MFQKSSIKSSVSKIYTRLLEYPGHIMSIVDDWLSFPLSISKGDITYLKNINCSETFLFTFYCIITVYILGCIHCTVYRQEDEEATKW